mgnify:CR=1 FL=1
MRSYTTDILETISGKKLEITFIVHASLKFRFWDRVIYLDPTSSLADFSGCEKADFIFYTHHHDDHFDLKALEQLSTPDTTIVCTKTVADAIPDRDSRDIEVMKNGDSFNFRKGFSVEAVPAYNYLMRERFHPQGRDNGYIMTFDGLKVYVAGDTDRIPEGEAVQCDIALVPIGGTYTMNAAEAAEFVNALRPHVVIPTHYASIVGSLDDAREFVKHLDREIEVCLKID